MAIPCDERAELHDDAVVPAGDVHADHGGRLVGRAEVEAEVADVVSDLPRGGRSENPARVVAECAGASSNLPRPLRNRADAARRLGRSRVGCRLFHRLRDVDGAHRTFDERARVSPMNSTLARRWRDLAALALRISQTRRVPEPKPGLLLWSGRTAAAARLQPGRRRRWHRTRDMSRDPEAREVAGIAADDPVT